VLSRLQRNRRVRRPDGEFFESNARALGLRRPIQCLQSKVLPDIGDILPAPTGTRTRFTGAAGNSTLSTAWQHALQPESSRLYTPEVLLVEVALQTRDEVDLK
jgi:hypothetical protein